MKHWIKPLLLFTYRGKLLLCYLQCPMNVIAYECPRVIGLPLYVKSSKGFIQCFHKGTLLFMKTLLKGGLKLLYLTLLSWLTYITMHEYTYMYCTGLYFSHNVLSLFFSATEAAKFIKSGFDSAFAAVANVKVRICSSISSPFFNVCNSVFSSASLGSWGT